MKGLVLLLLAVAVILSFGFAAANMDILNSMETKNIKNIKTTEDNKLLEFSTFTKSVCQGSGKFTKCESQLFVNCSGRIYKAEYFNGCNGMELDVPAVSGFAVFDNNKWKDQRK